MPEPDDEEPAARRDMGLGRVDAAGPLIPCRHRDGPLRFLARSSGPVIFGKLALGKSRDWNPYPRDIAHLAAWLELAYERPFGWQITSPDWPTARLLETPILVVSGKDPFSPTPEQMAKLRAYVEGGGLLLGIAADDSKAFAESFRMLLAELWPDLPLAPVGNNHPILKSYFRLQNGRSGLDLTAVDNGVRTLAILSAKDIAGRWERLEIASGRAQFEFGANLANYATGAWTGAGQQRRQLRRPATSASRPR